VNVDDTCNLLALVAIPTRLRVLRALADGPLDRAGVLAALGEDGGAPGLSGQFDLLRSGGLVEWATREEGDGVYRATDAGKRVVAAVELVG
jgi:DNA-binding transcriptional ArsR family regulator